MNYCSLRSVLYEMWHNKAKVFIFAVIIALLCGGYGVKKSIQHNKEVAETEEEESYQTILANKQESVENAKDAVKQAKDSFNAQKEYIDNSTYMKLNPDKVYLASVQYFLTDIPEYDTEGVQVSDPGKISNVIQEYFLYVNQGSFKANISREYNNISSGEVIDEEKLTELVSINNTDRFIYVNMFCVDESMAIAMINCMKKSFEAQKSVIEVVHGPFDMVLQNAETSIFTSTEINDVQIGRRDALKSYEYSVNDALDRWNDEILLRDIFITENRPEDFIGSNPKREGVLWGIFGLVLGIGLSFVLLCVRYITKGYLGSTEDVLNLNISVLGYINESGSNTERIQQDMKTLRLLAERKNLKILPVWNISSQQTGNMVVNSYEDELLLVINQNEIDEVAINKLSMVGSALICVELHRNTFEEIVRCRNMLISMNIDVIGSIIVE